MGPEKGSAPVLLITALLISAALTMGIHSMMANTSVLSVIDRQKQTSKRMSQVRNAMAGYYICHSKDASGTLPSPDASNRVPVSELGLDPICLLDVWGRPFYYSNAASITGVTVDGQKAAGYLISGGPDQAIDTAVGGASVTSSDKDIVVPIDLLAEAVNIAQEDLLVLSKAQWAYFCKHYASPNPPTTGDSMTMDTILTSFKLADRYKTDPWGNAYRMPSGATGTAYSLGPNGVDENRSGDDLSVPLISRACPAANTNLLANNSFETLSSLSTAEYNLLVSQGYVNLAAGNTGLDNWNIGGNGIVLSGTLWNTSSGTYSIHLNSPAGPGSISQDFITARDQRYLVSFDMSGYPSAGVHIKILSVSAAGQAASFAYDNSSSTTANMRFTRRYFTFTATGTLTALKFASQVSGSYGPVLDNISVTATTRDILPNLNGDFEDSAQDSIGVFQSIGSSPNSSIISGWTASNVDVVGTYWNAQSGGRSLDLSGSSAGSVYQDISTAAGSKYQVSFAMAGNPDCGSTLKNMQVSVNNDSATSQTYAFDTIGRTRSSMGWVQYTFDFTSSASTTRLVFLSLDSSGCGPALDNVLVERIQ